MDDGTYLEEIMESVCYSEERKQQDVDCPLKTALTYIRRSKQDLEVFLDPRADRNRAIFLF